MKEIRTHDTISRKVEAAMGSDRNFGMVFAVVFALIGVVPAFFNGIDGLHLWALGVAAVFLLLALVKPKLLNPLNKLWFRFGLLLHAVISPIIMGLVYIISIVPTGLIMKALGKDMLRLRRRPDADTYWISREPGPTPESFKQQF